MNITNPKDFLLLWFAMSLSPIQFIQDDPEFIEWIEWRKREDLNLRSVKDGYRFSRAALSTTQPRFLILILVKLDQLD